MRHCGVCFLELGRECVVLKTCVIFISSWSVNLDWAGCTLYFLRIQKRLATQATSPCRADWLKCRQALSWHARVWWGHLTWFLGCSFTNPECCPCSPLINLAQDSGERRLSILVKREGDSCPFIFNKPDTVLDAVYMYLILGGIVKIFSCYNVTWSEAESKFEPSAHDLRM